MSTWIIIAGILLVVILIIYFIFRRKGNDNDDFMDKASMAGSAWDKCCKKFKNMFGGGA